MTIILWEPQTLAAELGITLPDPSEGASSDQAAGRAAGATTAAEPIDLDLEQYPTVKEALETVTTPPDRSKDTMRVMYAAFDAGLIYEQACYAVNSRADLGERLNERDDDDLLRCWIRVVNSRQTLKWADISVDGATAAGHDYGAAATTLEDIEANFWQRQSLQTIKTAALSRMCSPWAVLAYTAARALALVRPCIVLPPLIGGPGSLNCFAGIAAASGGGKGAAKAVTRTLVPHHVEERMANLPAAASMSASADHAEVLVFVNQTITVGNDPPTRYRFQCAAHPRQDRRPLADLCVRTRLDRLSSIAAAVSRRTACTSSSTSWVVVAKEVTKRTTPGSQRPW